MNLPQVKLPQAAARSGARRWPRPLVWLGALAALVAAFYAEEDWRGRRDWNQYRKGVEARGDHLEFQAYIPKPVPNEQNFAAVPIVESWMQTYGGSILPNDLYSRANDYVEPTNGLAGHRHLTDLAAWQMAADALLAGPLDAKHKFATDKTDLVSREQAATVVLEGMKPDEAYFADLRLAGERPYSRFPIEYDREFPSQIPLIHFSRVKQACQHLSLQACAELAAGQPDNALSDVNLMLYLADSIKTEPFIISCLVRLACFQVAIQPVWEGLAEHRWTAFQLAELELRFQRYDFLTDLTHSLKSERTYGIAFVDEIRKKGLSTLVGGVDYSNVKQLEITELFGAAFQKTSLNLIGRIAPAGWYDLERLNYSTLSDEETQGVMDLALGRVFPGRVAFNSAEITRQLEHGVPLPLEFIVYHQAIVAEYGATGLSSTPIRAATAQTTANQAAIACALERCRLANGQFPDKLEALAPQFISRLPNDVLTGQPYKYRRTDDGQFVLYSVGWNLKDDGGVPGKRLFDDKEGDWVWDYPVK